ncbi:WD40 repeat domain-containing protein [Streptomyces sp. B-S-A8]|uniref:WD40 repeat domain-containing protein n=1 Tax=Streptomyces solicavernae TaxID=3043614 RepID=A0ABT6RYU3_9ACTN|nr:WD40 repeat domain-containing protein [Streptomyces sp. B-S-A8]MDI3389572.1 WD40 repeat domain-containing protein [Streptomyces sp. B-S-A8]
MIQHKGPISGIAAWQDKYVATAGYDNQVICWDQSTGRAVSRSLHDHLANQVQFSPDGRHLVTSSSDYTARLWSVPDLRLVAVLAEQEDDVEMSVFHPSRELIATASRDHRVRAYDFTGRLLATFTGHTADVISVEWARDRDELISSSDDGTIKRWSLESGGLIDDLDMDGVETDTVAISSGGTIFAGNDEGQIIVVEPSGRTLVSAHEAGIKRLVLDDSRDLLVSLSYDRTMRLWNVASGTPELHDTTALPHDVWPRSCAFAGGSRLVYATFGATYRTYDYEARTWDSSEVPPTLGVNAVLPEPSGSALTVGDAGLVHRDRKQVAATGSLCNFLTPLGPLVLTGGQLGKVFDALTGRELHQHRSPLNCAAAFERDGDQYAVVGAYTGEGLLMRLDREGGPGGSAKATHVRDLDLHGNAVKGIAVSGDLLFSVAADASATWYRISDLTKVATVEDAHDRIANGCAGLDDGWFASVSRDLKLRLWDPQRRAEVLDTPHTHSVKCVAASEDGRLVATGSYNGQVAVYDRSERAWSTVERPTTAGISSLAYDPERKVFAASSYDGEVYRIGG